MFDRTGIRKDRLEWKEISQMFNSLGAARARFASILLTATVLVPGVVMAANMGSTPVMVGGQAMLPSRDIIDNAVNSADHTTLVAAVKAAGLVATLKGPGPFTVFAPTNEAFAELPAGTVDSLLQPDNKGKLTKILTYHVVAGRMDFHALEHKIQDGGGEAKLKTVSGGTLTAKMNGAHNIVLEDEMGHYAHISTYDVYQSNGVIQVIDHVLMPQ